MPKPKLSHIPSRPGIYQMIDAKGKIIYIGKSVNLKSRVRSYFVPNASLNFGKKKMVAQVAQVDYVETRSDMEALVLETNLIKAHQPKYNVLMKDDKNLSYIKISDDEIPLVTRTRNKTAKWKYYGPYSQYLNVSSTLHELKKIFCLGNHLKLKKGKQPPCMDTYIGICPGHCTGDPSKIETYKKNLAKFEVFMDGDVKEILSDLQTQMKEHASRLEFEEAGRIKNRLEQLSQIHDRQIVRDAIGGDHDVIVLLCKYDKVFVWSVQLRWWKVVGVYHHILSNPTQESEDALLQDFLMSRYVDGDIRWSILLEKEYDLDSVLDFLKEKKISIHVPARWEKMDIIGFAKNDLLNFALASQMSQLTNKTLKKSDMISLLSMLFPEKDMYAKQKDIIFECYDISHHQWEHTVASKSVIHNGKTANARYKKYKIKTLKSGMIDDFASMHEVLARRTRSYCEWKESLPDLIIIDGWKGQLNKAIEAIESIYSAFSEKKDIQDIVNICSVAKREEEIFLPGEKKPIILSKWSPELMLVQRARDEAHRFAINFNRQKREKSYTKTILEEIPGIWPKTRQALLQKFWGLDGIENADEREIKKILSAKQFQSLKEYGIVVS